MSTSKYTEDFKKQVAEATLEEGMSLAKVGKKFNVHPTLVRNWRIKYTKKEDVQGEQTSGGKFTIEDVKNETEPFKKLCRELDYHCEDIRGWLLGEKGGGQGEKFFSYLPSGASGTLWQDIEVEDDKLILKTTIYTDEGSEAEFNEAEFFAMLKKEWEEEYKYIFDRYGTSIDAFTWTSEVTDQDMF